MSGFSSYKRNVGTLVADFEGWINQPSNQLSFNSLQEAFKSWLNDKGFSGVEGDYTTAVAVILTYQSLCLANPAHRRYLSNPDNQPDEYTVIQVNVPAEGDDITFWEFFTQNNFNQMYADWLESYRSQ